MSRLPRFSCRVLLPALLLLVLCLGTTPAPAGPPPVELYVTSWCPYCKKAAAYFQSKGVAFTAYDIEKDNNALQRFQKYHAQGVPLAVIGGKPIAGYATEEYDKALGGQ